MTFETIKTIFAVLGLFWTVLIGAGALWLWWDNRRLQRMLDAHFDEIGAD